MRVFVMLVMVALLTNIVQADEIKVMGTFRFLTGAARE